MATANPTPEEIIYIFSKNGIDIRDLESAMEEASEAGATDEEIKNFVLNKYNGLKAIDAEKESQAEDKEPSPAISSQETPVSKSTNSPGIIKGTLQEVYKGLSGGLAPYIEGAKATNIGKIVNGVLSPGSALINPPDLSGPLFDKQAYEQTKQQFIEEQQAFHDEHPTLSTGANIVGQIGGVALTGGTVGAATKSYAVAKGLPRAVGAIARAIGVGRKGAAFARWATPNIAASGATFGTYEAAQGLANEGKGLDPIQAAEKAAEGSLVGIAFGAMTGPISVLESKILKTKAMSELAGAKKILAQGAVKEAMAAGEGAGLAVISSGIEERRLPTAEEVASSALVMTGLRGATYGFEVAAREGREYLTPTKEMKERDAKRRMSERQSDLIKQHDIVKAEAESVAQEAEQADKISNELRKRLVKAKQEMSEVKEQQRQLGIEDRFTNQIQGRVQKAIGKIKESDRKIAENKKGVEELGKEKEELKSDIKMAREEMAPAEKEFAQQKIEEKREEVKELKRLDKNFNSEGERHLLQELRREGADYNSTAQIDKEAYSQAGIRNKKGGIKDSLSLWLMEKGYMSAEYPRTYEELVALEDKAASLIERAMNGEKIYPLGTQEKFEVFEQAKADAEREAGKPIYERLEEAKEELATLRKQPKTPNTDRLIQSAKDRISAIQKEQETLARKNEKERVRLFEREKTAEATEQQEEINYKWGRALGVKSKEILSRRETELKQEISDLRKAIKDIDSSEAKGEISSKEMASVRDKAVESKQKLADKREELKLIQAEQRWINDKLNGGKKPATPEVEVYEEDVKAVKNKAKQPISTELAADIARDLKLKRATKQAAKENALTFRERMIRLAQWVRNATNTYKPIERATRGAEEVDGKPINAKDRPEFVLRRGDRAGETSQIIERITSAYKEAEKKNPFAIHELDRYLGLRNRQVDRARDISNLEKKASQAQETYYAKDSTPQQKAAAQRQYKEARAQLDEMRAIKNTQEDIELARIEKEEPEIVELANKIYKENEDVLDIIKDSGRISEEMYADLKARKGYSPEKMEILSKEEMDQVSLANGPQSALRKRTGKGIKENRVITALRRIKQWRYFANREQAKKLTVKYLQKTGEAWEAPVSKRTVKEGQIPDYDRNNQIITWENGKAHVWNVPKNIAKVFNTMAAPEEGEIAKAARLLQNSFKFGTTGGSIGFAPFNVMRDTQSVYGFSRSGQYATPSMVQRSAKLYFTPESNLTPAERQLKKIIGREFGEESTFYETEFDLRSQETKDVANMMDASVNANPEGSEGEVVARTAMDVLVNKMLPSFFKAIKAGNEKLAPLFEKTARTMSFLGNASEKTSRATVFQTELMRRAGSERRFNQWMEHPEEIPEADIAEAAAEMYKVTLDFNTKMAPTIENMNRYLFPYLKPAIIGANRAIDVLSSPEIAPQAWRFMTNLGMLQALINTEYDKEQKQRLQEWNADIKSKSFGYVSKDGTLTKFPLVQEGAGWIGIFGAVAERMLQKIRGKEVREGMKDEVFASMEEIAQNLVPFGYFLNRSNYLATVPGKLIFEQSTNIDSFSGAPIESERMKGLPPELRYSAYTPKIYKMIGKKLGWSPKRIEHFSKKLFSTAGKEWAAAADAVMEVMGIGEDEWDLPRRIEDGPVLGRFFEKRGTAYSRNVQDYEKLIQPMKEAYNAQKAGAELSAEQKDMAGLYKKIRLKEANRINLISQNTKIMAKLKKDGYEAYDKYKRGEISHEQFKREKEIAVTNALKKYEENQMKVNENINDMLLKIRKKKEQKNWK